MSPENARPSRDDLAQVYLGGSWCNAFDGLFDVAPLLLEAHLRLAAVPWRHEGLDGWFRELVYIAVDTSITHMYSAGVRMHVAKALRIGATTGHIVETLSIAGLVGVESAMALIPVILDECKRAGQIQGDERAVGPEAPAGMDPDMGVVAQLAPELAAAYDDLSRVVTGHLTRKQRSLIAFAVDAAATHLNVDRARAHIRAAIYLGATRHELVEVLELVSALGVHACLTGADALVAYTAGQDVPPHRASDRVY